MGTLLGQQKLQKGHLSCILKDAVGVLQRARRRKSSLKRETACAKVGEEEVLFWDTRLEAVLTSWCWLLGVSFCVMGLGSRPPVWRQEPSLSCWCLWQNPSWTWICSQGLASGMRNQLSPSCPEPFPQPRRPGRDLPPDWVSGHSPNHLTYNLTRWARFLPGFVILAKSCRSFLSLLLLLNIKWCKWGKNNPEYSRPTLSSRHVT